MVDEAVFAAGGLAAPRDLAHALVRSTAALVNVSGRGGRLLLVNPALQAFTGLSEQEMLGRPFWDVFVITEDVPRAREAFGRALSGGLDFPEEGDWVAAGGLLRRIAMQNCVLRDEDGQPYAVACVGIDVTEDRRTTELLGERASIDSLTGVRNRSALFQALGRQLHPAGRVDGGDGRPGAEGGEGGGRGQGEGKQEATHGTAFRGGWSPR